MTDNFPFKQALATDELDLERTISYREDSSNSDKFLHCNTTNTKIFDLEGTPPNLFISGNGDLDTVVNTITQNLARNLVRNPPSPWMKKGVGAQANVRGAILFLRQALENNIFFEHRYNLFLRSVKTVCFGNRDWIICFGDSQNNVAHSSSKTIVAHEIFHSFIHHINRPRGFEAKALVESYCDIFAILFKNKDKNKNEDWEWKIGDEITGFDARDLSLNSNSNGILDISSYQNVKGQTTNNSLIH